MNKLSNTRLAIVASLFLIVACKKQTPTPSTTSDTLQKDIVASLATNVNTLTYSKLASSCSELYSAITTFCASPSEQGLENCRTLWKATRAIWEQSEGFLYGPVSSQNIDPRIDTWPVDYTALENVLSSNIEFTEQEINALDDALKGFHPIEYLIFGQNGAKKYDQFTQREKDYLMALGLNIKTLTHDLSSEWNVNKIGNFHTFFTSPSESNPYYKTQKEVYLEIVNALIGICDEVGNGKIQEPFLAQDPSLEESPFSSNSITDFTNNMKSVQNVYLGRFEADNVGLDELVKKYNLSLDQTINTKINSAITALNTIKSSFSTAIIDEPLQVQNAINAINSLKETLETGLLPFVQQTVQ